jgi:hypothetical protein
MTRRMTKEFIKKNCRSPTKDEFIAIQHEAVNTLINNNSVYGICGQGETKMSEIVFKGKPTPTEGQVIDHTLDPKVAFTSYREQEHEDQLPPPPPLEIELSGKKFGFLPGSTRIRCDFKIMTKEMYENFVKQGKKFVTLIGGHECDSLEETGIDLDGDIVIVDGQKYAVDSSIWRR